MSMRIDRRTALGLFGASGVALVTGFDPVGRRWVTTAEASGGCPTFADVPPLDGVLLLDDASRAADAKDKGNIVHQPPCAVLRPGSVRDIQRMIRYCRRYDVKVAVRGQAHTMFGQSLSPGLVIENGTLNQIHSIGPDGADVDAGVRWKDLIIAAYDHGLTPPVITGYTNLSIGGTLSVGGVSGRNYAGAQVDHVRVLDVVTGEGNFRRCSMDENRDLFEVMLAGLGQCGVMTRVKTDLVPAKSKARLYNINYTDNAAFFRDLRTLINRGELNECFNLWVPPMGPTPAYQIQAVKYFDDAAPPNDAHLMRGLSVPADQIPHQDFDYLAWVLSVDGQIDFLRANFAWDDLIKPWFDVWLPDDTVEQYVGEVMSTLTVADLGPFGFLLLFPLRRSSLTRPFFRVPSRRRGDWVYLFDILTASPTPGPNPAYTSAMLARNRHLFEKARDAGGTRYPIGALEFDRLDWVRQYGLRWPAFAERKRRFDPDNILSPGSGIF
jgi:FAD/FMN-containing dehydrogenase